MLRYIFLVIAGIAFLYGAKSSIQWDEKQIVIGRLEKVHVMAADMSKKARIDTGAKTTSIDAREIKPFVKDGKEWVRFTFNDKLIETPLVRMVRIKRHGAKPIRRPVVELELQLAQVTKRVEVTLTNREKYHYPILIGRNFLRKNFMVDVNRVFISSDNQRIAAL